MPNLDQMNEQELVGELHSLASACERLNYEIACATQRQRFTRDSGEASRAAQEEQTLLAQMDRLMIRRRAVEGHLLRVRGQLRPLKLEEKAHQTVQTKNELTRGR